MAEEPKSADELVDKARAWVRARALRGDVLMQIAPEQRDLKLACTRGRRRRVARCACGAPAPLLCDGPGAGAGKTCDRPICRGCARHSGPDRDLCLECAAVAGDPCEHQGCGELTSASCVWCLDPVCPDHARINPDGAPECGLCWGDRQ